MEINGPTSLDIARMALNRMVPLVKKESKLQRKQRIWFHKHGLTQAQYERVKELFNATFSKIVDEHNAKVKAKEKKQGLAR